jgi:hypothetical protein
VATALSYVISYFFIAIIWVNHHHLLRFAREATSLSKGLSTKGKADLRNVESALLQRFVEENPPGEWPARVVVMMCSDSG